MSVIINHTAHFSFPCYTVKTKNKTEYKKSGTSSRQHNLCPGHTFAIETKSTDGTTSGSDTEREGERVTERDRELDRERESDEESPL